MDLRKLYNDFMQLQNLPSFEEFEKTCKSLPPFDHFNEDADPFDVYYEQLDEYLIKYGVMADLDCIISGIDFQNKTIECTPENLEELDKIQTYLKSIGWSIEDYEDTKEFLIEEAADDEKLEVIKDIREIATVEELTEFLKELQSRRS